MREPEIACTVPPAAHAHARIDTWAQATGWIQDRLAQGPAPADKLPIEGLA